MFRRNLIKLFKLTTKMQHHIEFDTVSPLHITKSKKGLPPEGAILVPLFIRLMAPNGAIQRSKNCHNEVIISSQQG